MTVPEEFRDACNAYVEQYKQIQKPEFPWDGDTVDAILSSVSQEVKSQYERSREYEFRRLDPGVYNEFKRCLQAACRAVNDHYYTMTYDYNFPRNPKPITVTNRKGYKEVGPLLLYCNRHNTALYYGNKRIYRFEGYQDDYDAFFKERVLSFAVDVARLCDWSRLHELTEPQKNAVGRSIMDRADNYKTLRQYIRMN